MAQVGQMDGQSGVAGPLDGHVGSRVPLLAVLVVDEEQRAEIDVKGCETESRTCAVVSNASVRSRATGASVSDVTSLRLPRTDVHYIQIQQRREIRVRSDRTCGCRSENVSERMESVWTASVVRESGGSYRRVRLTRAGA